MPPASGPIATAAPIVAPQIPNAVPRSLPWNSCEISASAVANIIAPPIPWTPRAMIRKSASLASAAGERGDGEEDDAQQEDPLAAEEVGERAGGQDAGREGERVGVDHPLEVGERGVERPLDRRQGDVHDRDVQQQHESGRTHGHERPRLPLHGGNLHLESCSKHSMSRTPSRPSWPGSATACSTRSASAWSAPCACAATS